MGPGLITTNIVPLYNGWKEFEEFLHKIVDGLFKNSPSAERTLRIEKIHLRFIDGFDDSFWLENYSEFAANMLGVQLALPENFIPNSIQKGAGVAYMLEYR